MANYTTRKEIKEGAAKVEQLSTILEQAVFDLTENEHASDEEQQKLDEAANRIIAMAWDICFPPATITGVYGDISHLWNIEQTKH